jgi:hypothetical protein
MSKIKNYSIVFLVIIVIASCKKKEKLVAPIISNEVITTVQLILTNTNTPFDKDTATWQQLLDVNGNPLPQDTSKAILNLHANTIYAAQVLMYDKTQNPATNVSDEVKQRANYHLFFFQPTPISPSNYIINTTTTNIPGTATSASGPYLNLTVNRTDYDTNNPPLQVGLADNFVSGTASDGHLRMVMRHQPNVKNGAYDPGDSDVDISFRVHIY